LIQTRICDRKLIRGHFEASCAELAVAVAANSPELLGQTARVFRTWRRRLAELLEQRGLRPLMGSDSPRPWSHRAKVLSSWRAEHSLEPFDLVAEQLLEQVRTLARDVEQQATPDPVSSDSRGGDGES
jgi:TetR/AcrR family transcriptional repressor of lmrAB and yxaGH operons